MTEPAPTLKFYTATGCEPCVEVKIGLREGNYDILGVEGDPEVEEIDLANEENYGSIDELRIDELPAAYYGARQCKIFVDNRTKKIIFDCQPEKQKGKIHLPNRKKR